MLQPETLPRSRWVDSNAGEEMERQESPKQLEPKHGRDAGNAVSTRNAAPGGTRSPVIPFPAAPAREKS